VTYASTLPRHLAAERPFELKQLYTDPDRLGRGLGARLMDWALAEARKVGADVFELSVYADNPDAQRFYARYGLNKIADITFKVGEHIDPEFLFGMVMQPETTA
jgi:GNAT superfamily N-acetyltransferase